MGGVTNAKVKDTLPTSALPQKDLEPNVYFVGGITQSKSVGTLNNKKSLIWSIVVNVILGNKNDMDQDLMPAIILNGNYSLWEFIMFTKVSKLKSCIAQLSKYAFHLRPPASLARAIKNSQREVISDSSEAFFYCEWQIHVHNFDVPHLLIKYGSHLFKNKDNNYLTNKDNLIVRISFNLNSGNKYFSTLPLDPNYKLMLQLATIS